MSHFIDEDVAHTTNGKVKFWIFQSEVLFNFSTCALLRRLGRIWESEREDIGIGAIGLGEVRDRRPVKSQCLQASGHICAPFGSFCQGPGDWQGPQRRAALECRHLLTS